MALGGHLTPTGGLWVKQLKAEFFPSPAYYWCRVSGFSDLMEWKKKTKAECSEFEGGSKERESRRTKVFLDLVEDPRVSIAFHHVDSKPSFAEATRAADPVKVGVVVGVPLHVHRKVKVDHDGHLLHVDSCIQTNGLNSDLWNFRWFLRRSQLYLWSKRWWSPTPSPSHSWSVRWQQLSAPLSNLHSAAPPGGLLALGLQTAKRQWLESGDKKTCLSSFQGFS